MKPVLLCTVTQFSFQFPERHSAMRAIEMSEEGFLEPRVVSLDLAPEH